MSRPFFPSRTTPSAEAGEPPKARFLAFCRAMNPVDGVPAPIPLDRRRPATPQERAMRNLWWDGFFAEGSEMIWLQYFSLYALAFGAGVSMIGALAALGNLIAALAMVPGALFAERTGRYKAIVLFAGGGVARLAFLVLAVLPWLATGNAALAVLAVIAALRGFFAFVAQPAWSAFAGAFVPEDLRGRYFASRNFIRQVASLSIAPLAGLVIYQLGGFAGWQLAWLGAFGLGMCATAFFARIPNEAALAIERRPAAGRPPARPALGDSRLLWFVVASGFFQLSVMLAGPFFAVYFVDRLGGSTFEVGLTSAVVPLAGIVAQPFIGKLHDRYGPKWLLVVSGLVFPLAPWGWMVVSTPWHVVVLNCLVGVLWAANLLASLNLVLAIAPPDKRASYSALQQGGVFLASFVGPLLGGALIPVIGFKSVFFLSGAGRAVATLVLWRLVSDEAPAPAARREQEPAVARL